MRRTLTAEELFCLEGCRTYEQYAHMRRGFEKGRCQFCNPDRKLNKVLYQDTYVHAWEVPRKFERPEVKVQLLVVPKRHVRAPWELTQDETLSVLAAQKFLTNFFNLEGGMVFARFGDMRLNAGTVPHLHYNIWVPSQFEEVRVPVFKIVADRKTNKKRAEIFSNRYKASR